MILGGGMTRGIDESRILLGVGKLEWGVGSDGNLRGVRTGNKKQEMMEAECEERYQ